MVPVYQRCVGMTKNQAETKEYLCTSAFCSFKELKV